MWYDDHRQHWYFYDKMRTVCTWRMPEGLGEYHWETNRLPWMMLKGYGPLLGPLHGRTLVATCWPILQLGTVFITGLCMFLPGAGGKGEFLLLIALAKLGEFAFCCHTRPLLDTSPRQRDTINTAHNISVFLMAVCSVCLAVAAFEVTVTIKLLMLALYAQLSLVAILIIPVSSDLTTPPHGNLNASACRQVAMMADDRISDKYLPACMHGRKWALPKPEPNRPPVLHRRDDTKDGSECSDESTDLLAKKGEWESGSGGQQGVEVGMRDFSVVAQV